MKKIGKIILLSFSCLCFNTVIAATNKNIKLTANALSGCEVRADNVNFGAISEINRKAYTSLSVQISGLGFESELNIDVKCSKNKSYTLNGEAMKNSTEFPGRYGQYMTGANTGKIIQYGLWFKSGANTGSWFSNGGTFGGYTSKNLTATGNGRIQNYKIFVGLYSLTTSGGKKYFELIPDNYSDNYTLSVVY